MLRNIVRTLATKLQHCSPGTTFNKNLLIKNNRYYSQLQENKKSDFEIHQESCISSKYEDFIE